VRLHHLLVCSALLLATPVFAQPGGGGGGRGGFGGGRGGFGGGGVSGLVRIAEVQKELGVTDEQKTEITKILEESRPMGGAGGGFNREEFQNLSQEERTKRFEEMRKAGEETAKKVEEKVKGVLNEQQWTRLSELRIQQQGIGALTRPEVAEKLALSEEQKKEIAKLNESLRPQFGGPGGGGGGERQSREEAMAQREKTQKEILAVLSEDQKDSFEKMKGAKFEFPRPMFGGGQGGGQGGSGRRRPGGDNN